MAATAWLGLALQFDVSLAGTGSPLLSLWILTRYFTILTNLAVALAFSGVAAGRARAASPRLMGGLTLAILLVGIVYRVLLYEFDKLHGLSAVADGVVHGAMPVLVPLFWLILVPKGGLSWRDPWRWAAFPVLYLCYALARGAFEPAYAYPFIDVGRIGLAAAATNVAVIAAGFLAASFAVVALDRRLATTGPSL